MKTNTAELLKLNDNSNLDGSEPRQFQSCLILDMTSITLIASKFKCAVLQIRPHCLSPIRHDENMSKGVILYNVWTVFWVTFHYGALRLKLWEKKRCNIVKVQLQESGMYNN